MSIRCGHCWSYHPTVGDVRECWEILQEHQPFCRLCSDPLADPIRRRRCAAGYKDQFGDSSDDAEVWVEEPEDRYHAALELAGVETDPDSHPADSPEEIVSEMWEMYFGDEYLPRPDPVLSVPGADRTTLTGQTGRDGGLRHRLLPDGQPDRSVERDHVRQGFERAQPVLLHQLGQRVELRSGHVRDRLPEFIERHVIDAVDLSCASGDRRQSRRQRLRGDGDHMGLPPSSMSRQHDALMANVLHPVGPDRPFA